MGEIIWSDLFRHRDTIHRRYPDIWHLTILRKRLPLMLRHIRNGERILDIGASHRDLEGRLKRYYPNLIYQSMDIDQTQFHDYYRLEDIEGKFHVILLFEVIEHLTLEDGVKMLGRIYDLLEKGGRLILTTPNVFNPSRYWRDATHKQAYCYDELGGLLLAKGFEIKEMYRTYNDAFHRYLFRVYVMSSIHRYLGIDFAKSILIVAFKEGKEER